MNINKQLFLDALFCRAFAWQNSRGILNSPPEVSDHFKRREGEEIGELARECYPRGILISGKSMNEALKETSDLLNSPDGTVFFEPAFRWEAFSTRADILMKTGNTWELIEVKSAVRIKARFKSDMAYTAMVMESSGLVISKMQLMYLNRNFIYGSDRNELFMKEDITEEIRALIPGLTGMQNSILSDLELNEKPRIPFSRNCKNCSGFKNCFDFNLDDHLISLPFLPRKVYEALMAKGIDKISLIPSAIKLNSQQTLMKTSLETGRTIISEALETELNKIHWPGFYLDFETTMTALPLYPDTTPFEQILTQYSIHICSEPGCVINHKEYLADPEKDCRRELAENLTKDLKGEGSILVYSGFEMRMIKNLINLFPDLAEELQKLLPRLVDLEKIIKHGIYHPGFKGRSSIKKTLPALVPHMTYENLSIKNGSAALTVFAEMARGKIPEEEFRQLREDLLNYCKQDTLGMVRLHEALIKEIEKGNPWDLE